MAILLFWRIWWDISALSLTSITRVLRFWPAAAILAALERIIWTMLLRPKRKPAPFGVGVSVSSDWAAEGVLPSSENFTRFAGCAAAAGSLEAAG